MEMIPNVILNPDKAPMITTEELENEIPEFKWSGGSSGRILPLEDAKNSKKCGQHSLKSIMMTLMVRL